VQTGKVFKAGIIGIEFEINFIAVSMSLREMAGEEGADRWAPPVRGREEN
jgi:hypothetical protein